MHPRMRRVRQWIRSWRRALMNQEATAPRTFASGLRMDRRAFFDRIGKISKAAAVIASAQYLQGCTAMLKMEYGYNHEFSTRQPDGVKSVIEKFPQSGELEMGFLKEVGVAGEIVGTATKRAPREIESRYSRFRTPRSYGHTHVVLNKGNPRIYTYPSPTDFEWTIQRIENPTRNDKTARVIHVVLVQPHVKKNNEDPRNSKGIGTVSIRLGKNWLWMEKNNPGFIYQSSRYYHELDRARVNGTISDVVFEERVLDFWTLMEKWGIHVQRRAYPGYKIENGYFARDPRYTAKEEMDNQ